MSKIRITISTDNAAFGDFESDEYYNELRRILRVLCNACTERHLPFRLKDVNGNSVGKVIIDEDKESPTTEDERVNLIKDPDTNGDNHQ